MLTIENGLIILFFCFKIGFIVEYYFIIRKSISEFTNKKISKNKIKTLKTYNDNLKTANDDIRAFRHDFNNIMQAIDGYIKLNDYEGLKSYYKDLYFECNIMKNLVMINPNIINNINLYNIIMKYSKEAKENSIIFNFAGFSDFRKVDVEIENIIEKMLKNAINISKKSIQKEITVTYLYDKNKKEDVLIVAVLYESIRKIKLKDSYIYNLKEHMVEDTFADGKITIKLEGNILLQQLEMKSRGNKKMKDPIKLKG